MKLVKNIVKGFLILLAFPLGYLIISLVFSVISTDRILVDSKNNKSIFLSTNGVHLDIIIPKNDLDSSLILGLVKLADAEYVSFGWGDENFYINTPTWNDLTFSNAFSAMFLKSSTLMHVTRHNARKSDWIEIKINQNELYKLNEYIPSTFNTDASHMAVILENQGYSYYDDFYLAHGSYSCINTCNSWVNNGFKASGLKACLWTPFDFGLLNMYD